MLAPAPAADRLFLRLAPLCAAMFLGFLTVSLPLPALPLHVTGALGFGTAVAGLTVGVQSLATLLTRAHAGRSVDADGPKATLVRGLLVCSGAGWLYLLSLAAASPALSLAVLLAGRAALGVGESLLITGVVSWGMSRAGPGRAGAAMSWNGMAQYGSLAAGAPVGFALFAAAGFAAVSVATALLPLFALGVVLPLDPVPAAGGTRLPLAIVLGRVWAPGLGLTMSAVGFAAVSTFASLDFADRGWDGAGFALLAYGACFVLVRTVAGGLPDRFGGVAVAAASMAVEAVGQAVLWSAPGPAAAFVGAGLTGLGCSLVFPSLGVEAFRRVPPDSRGIAVGAFAGFQDVAIGLTGPLLGSVAAASRPQAVFLIGGLAAAAGVLIAAGLRGPAALAGQGRRTEGP